MRDRLPLPDWRCADGYARLRRAGPEAFAWEWLRRDPRYCTAAADVVPLVRQRKDADAPRVLRADPAAARWGLHAFEDPALSAGAARPVWRSEWLVRVLAADALDSGSAGDRFDLARFAALATIVRGATGAEHVLLADGTASIRLDLASGTLLAAPVVLSYRLAGVAALRGPLDTLQRLLRLSQSGRLTAPPPSARNRRLVLLLRTCDALRSGATQRDIAAVLLSGEADAPRWRTEAPSLRTRAQRLTRGARAMAGGGYRTLLAR